MEGKLVIVGDKVYIPATVKSISEGEEYCNVTVETDMPMKPYTSPYSITLNAGQVVHRPAPRAEPENDALASMPYEYPIVPEGVAIPNPDAPKSE